MELLFGFFKRQTQIFIILIPEVDRTHLHTCPYTQTDTIRQTDGPLVPMVGLVPIEKDVIPKVQMHIHQ